MAGDPKKQSMISIATLCNDIKDTEETFTLQVLGELMVRGPNSSFYKSMVEPNIGAGFNSTTGYDSQTRDTTFTVGLQGLDPAQFDTVVDIYHETVDKAIEEGFDDKNIQGILHNIELNVKHQTPRFGLGILFGLNPVWNHEGDLMAPLRVNSQVSRFKKALRDNPRFLQDTLKEYLKDNSHRLILTMSPEEGYEKRQVEEEKKVLEGKVKGLGKADLDRIWKEGQELRREQEGRQGVEVLPSLGVEDLRREVERASVTKSRVEGVPVYVCTAPTNGVDYLTGVLGCGQLSEEERDLLPLLCHVLARMGTGKRDYRELDQAAQLKTGGLSAGMHISDHLESTGTFEEGLIFSAHSLERNTPHMIDLWTEVLTDADFRNVKRFETLLKVLASDLTCAIAGSGHLYAMSSAGSQVSPSALRSDRYGGLSFVAKVQELARRKDMGSLLAEVEGVREKVVGKSRLRVALNTRRRAGEESVLGRLLGSLEGDEGEGGPFYRKDILQVSQHSPHHLLNIPVSYAALAIPTVSYVHPSFPALRVLARLLTSQYLLPQIREKGGAYGAGAKLSSDGLFSFYSYRDPSPHNTYSVFEAASDWVRKGSFEQRDVDEAKLGVFQSLDAPQAPSSLGLRHFLYSLSDDVFQSHRLALMKLNKEDIISAAQLLDSPVRARALLGPENPKLPSDYNWKQIKSE
jgi:Zn-dependent M16 (insulinase) family peptidase